MFKGNIMKAAIIKLAILLIGIGSLIAAASTDAANSVDGTTRPTPTPNPYANLAYNTAGNEELPYDDDANTEAGSEDDLDAEVNINIENDGGSMPDKDKALLYYLKAKDLLDQGYDNDLKWEKFRRAAVRCLTKALSLDPDNRTYLIERARATDVDEISLQDLSKVIKMDPNNPEIYCIRARIYAANRNFNAASADYGKAIEIAPDNPTYYRERSIFFRLYLKDPDRELLDLNRILKLLPEDTLALRRRAEIYRDRNDYASALKDQNFILKLSPANALALIERAATYKAMGKFKEAVADCTAAIELYPEDSSFLLERADLYRKTGQAALALKDEKRAKELDAEYEKAATDASSNAQ